MDMGMGKNELVENWVARYETAWRARGTDALRRVFTEDATYRQSPYHEPHIGLDAIGAMWEREREGPDEVFTLASEVVVVDGDTAVVRVEARYGDPVVREYRDLWIVRIDGDGRCSAFEEWPFWPGQPIAAPRD
jgi:ketosteroid isomerase-like protein